MLLRGYLKESDSPASACGCRCEDADVLHGLGSAAWWRDCRFAQDGFEDYAPCIFAQTFRAPHVHRSSGLARQMID